MATAARPVEPEDLCRACRQMTKTIGGRCPNCGAVKDSSRVPVTNPYRGGSVWGDRDGLVQIGIFGTTTILIILGAIFVAPEILIALAIVLIAYGLINGALNI